MKAEIAKEMSRSRTQTPIPVPMRAGEAGVVAEGAGAVVGATELESEDVSGMSSYCIQITGAQQRFAQERSASR